MMKSNLPDISSSVFRCCISPDWSETGLARLTIARWNDKRGVTAVSFLVDTYCLGVKDAMVDVFRSPREFESDFIPLLYFDCTPEDISFQKAREIVCGAISYARNMGFEPHPDFYQAGRFLDIETYTSDGSVRFGGPSGKPLYVAGPFDPAEEIVRVLEARLGKDGFEFVYPTDAPE